MQRSAGPRIKLELNPDHTRNNYELHWKWSRIKFEIIPNLTGYVTGLNKNDSGSNSQWSWIKLKMIPDQTGWFRIKLEKIPHQTGKDTGSNWKWSQINLDNYGSIWNWARIKHDNFGSIWNWAQIKLEILWDKKGNVQYKIWVNWVSIIVHCAVASVLKKRKTFIQNVGAKPQKISLRQK